MLIVKSLSSESPLLPGVEQTGLPGNDACIQLSTVKCKDWM